MGKHARVSPSAAKQILNCPPSLITGERFQDEESPFAAEGTAGHSLAEHLIKKYLKIRTRRPTSNYFTDEILEGVDEYVAYVIEKIELARKVCKNPILLVEQRVDLSELVKDCFGTADMVIITDTAVHIIDLKLGKGVQVSAENNYQLMIYGLGMFMVAEMLFDITTVKLTIVQPRLNSLSDWEISAEDLKAWGNEVFVPRAELALAGEGDFASGDWCRFCKCRFQCRQRNEDMLALAKMEFMDPPLLSDSEMTEVLAVADSLKKWAEECYSWAQNEAVTNHKEWPGFKLVEGRANRKYTDEDEVVDAAKSSGYMDVFKQSLIGITEMEKLMGKKQFNEILGNLVYKPQGKVTLVPLSDKREPINLATANDDFAE